VFPTIILAGVAIFFSTSYLVIKSTNLPAVTFALFRGLVPTILLWSIPSVRSEIKRNYSLPLISLGFLTALRIFAWISAAKLAPMGLASVVLFVWPVFFVLADSIRRKSPPSYTEFGGALCAFLGIAIARVGFPRALTTDEFLGLVLIFFVAIGNTFVLMVNRSLQNRISPEVLLFYDTALVGLIFLPFAAEPIIAASWQDLKMALFFGFAYGCLGWYLMFRITQTLPAHITAFVMYLEPAAAIVFGWLFLDEPLTFITILGGLLLACGGVITKLHSIKSLGSASK
jgi:drug/metabolite transporter (DMT)-like permease